MQLRLTRLLELTLWGVIGLLALRHPAAAQQIAEPHSRIAGAIDDRATMSLSRDIHPLARQEFDQGEVSPDTPIERVVLVLAPDAVQQKELDELVAAQQDPKSPEYRRWLTPQAFGERFGVSKEDCQRIVDWLEAQGFVVEPLAPARRSIVFSGTASQIRSAFHTSIHTYNVNGKRHFANAEGPQIPKALAGVVSGFVSLHDFHAAPLHHGPRPVTRKSAAPRAVDDSGGHYLAPADFSQIYGTSLLYTGSTNGAGETIAIVGRTNIHLSDVETFRSGFSLPANDPTIVLNGPDPGIISEDEEAEAVLDVEWSGAVAPQASVQLVVSGATNTTDGVVLSAQYIVNQNIADVVSASFGSCELYMGTAENQFWQALWQQAATQGITVLVASGDSGVAGCDGGSESDATATHSVNGLCSPPSSTCVGGTEFNDTANPANFWSPSGNALSYIPEAAWNESGKVPNGSGLWATGGGPSMFYPKPPWQTGAGVPADGWRDVPDVALSAAVHDAYLIYMEFAYWSVGGTSAASPSFAGIMALAAQQTGSRLGSANPTLYTLAANQAAVFHDVTAGNNSVPGLTGYSAGAGYDMTTGLGSVDAAQLVNHWNDAANASGAFRLSASPASVSVIQGTSATATVELNPGEGFSAPVTLSASGLPAGVTAGFSPATVPAGSASSTLTLTAGMSVVAGTNAMTVTGSGGGVTRYLAVPVTVATACTYSVNPTSAQVAAAAASYSINVIATNSAGAAACPWTAVSNNSWLTITSTVPASGNQTLTYSAAANTAGTPRSGTLTIAGLTFPVTQAPAPASFTLSASPSALTLAAGSSVTVGIGVVGANGFQGSVALNITGLPAGVTAGFNPATLSSGGGASLAFTAAATAASASATVTITGASGALTATLRLTLTVTATPGFTLGAGPSPATVVAGASTTTSVSVTAIDNFAGKVALTASGLPIGVTALFTPASIAPGATASLKLTAASSVAVSSTIVTVKGASGALASMAQLSLNVTPAPGFTLSAAPVTVAAGSSASTTVNVTGQGGFQGNVALSLSTLPAGVTASFNPTQVAAGGSSQLTLTAAPTAPVTSRSLTLTGVSGSQQATKPLTVIVTVASSFTLSAAPPAVGLVPGSTAVTNVSVTGKGGFGGNVSLSLPGLPSGVTAAFNTAQVAAGGTSVLTLSAAPNASASSENLALNGASGSLTATTPLKVSLTAAGFMIGAPQSPVTVTAGSSASTSVSVVAAGNFSGKVTLGASGLPAGVAAVFTPSAVAAGGAATLKFTAAATAPVFSGNVIVTGSYSGVTGSAPLSLSVAAAPGFVLAASPATATVVSGSSASVNIRVTRVGGFTGNVIMSVTGLPPGVTAAFNPPSLAADGSSTLTLTAAASAAASSANLIVAGASGSLRSTATVGLSVAVAPGFVMTATPPSLTLSAGVSAGASIVVGGRGGFQDTVALAVSGLPAGVIATITPPSVAPGSTATVKLTAAGAIVSSVTSVTLTGSSGNLTSVLALKVTVNAPGFSIRTGASSLTVGYTLSASTTVTVTPAYGFTGSVTLAATGLPCGVTASFTPGVVLAGATAKMTLTSYFASEITTNIVITGSSGSLTASTELSLTANSDMVGFKLLANPTFVDLPPGGRATTSITMQPTGGYTGKAALDAVIVPPGVTASVSPSQIGPNQKAVLTLTASASAPAPTGYVQVQGAMGRYTMGLLRITLNNDVPGFSFEPVNLGTSILQGDIDTALTIDFSGGFNGDIQLSFSGLPPGVIGSFQNTPMNITNVRSVWFELAAGVTAVPSPPTTVTIQGTSGNLTASTDFEIAVQPTPYFWVDPPVEFVSDSDYFSTPVGGTATAKILGIGNGAGFTVSVSGTPPNAAATLTPLPPSEYLLSIATTSQTPAGCYVINYIGTAPGQPVFRQAWPLILTVTQ